MRAALVLAVLPLLLAACQPAGEQAAFREALNAYLTHRGACIDAASFEEGFPTTVTMGNMERAELDLLVDVGLLQVTDTVATNAFAQQTQGRVTDPAKQYALTALGEEHHRVQTYPTRGEVHQLCYGTPHVVAIAGVGTPEEVGGRETVEVRYTYAVQDVAEWVTRADFLQKHPTVEREIDSQQNPVRADAVLVGDGDGWVHQALVPGSGAAVAP